MLPDACSLRLAHMRSTSFQLAQRLSSGISSYPGGWKAQRRASARVSLWPRAIWTFHNLRSTPQSFALIMSGDIASLSSASLELDKVAPFLIKLFEIVSSPASNCLISWSEMGDSFRIIDRTKFAQVSAATGWGEWHFASLRECCYHFLCFGQDILPLYFKHDNLRSFIRQLNIYGFQRVPNASG